ncbi:radiation-inducible immediate-early gene IEX-1-like [Cetorhinus maximus]
MCRGCHHPSLANRLRALPVRHDGGTALIRQRSSDPEVFTFDTILEVHPIPAAHTRLRSKRRVVKVLYPAQVRKYLPPEKKDWAKRMLLLFLSVVIVQVYTATEVNEEVANVVITPVAPGGPQANLSREWALGVSTSSEELFIPNNGSVTLLPKLPARGVDDISPAVTNPPEIVICYGMRSGPMALRRTLPKWHCVTSIRQ